MRISCSMSVFFSQTAKHIENTIEATADNIKCRRRYKLDCSQAFRCLLMADQRLVEMLVFIFALRIFGYKRLAQDLIRSRPEFSSFLSEYLDPVVKIDQGTRCAEDIGVAANKGTDPTWIVWAVFRRIIPARLKPTVGNWNFGIRQFQRFGRRTSFESVSEKAR